MSACMVGIVVAGCTSSLEKVDGTPPLDRPGLWVGSPDAAVPDGVAVPVALAGFKSRGFRMCSRRGPSGVTSYWEVSREDVQRVDHALLAHLRTAHKKMTMAYQPEKFLRQYAGFRRGERPFIYVNAFPSEEMAFSKADPSKGLFIGCDGGDLFWGIEYDVGRGTFDEFEPNGSYGP